MGMTLKEAIETGKSIKEVCEGLFPEKEQEAMSLLIEAGKRVKEHREECLDITFRALPGETKE